MIYKTLQTTHLSYMFTCSLSKLLFSVLATDKIYMQLKLSKIGKNMKSQAGMSWLIIESGTACHLKGTSSTPDFHG